MIIKSPEGKMRAGSVSGIIFAGLIEQGIMKQFFARYCGVLA